MIFPSEEKFVELAKQGNLIPIGREYPADAETPVSAYIKLSGQPGGAAFLLESAETGGRRGAGEILLTSMDRDGMKEGYDLALTRMASSRVSVPVIASGGAGTKEHFAEVLGEAGGAEAALAASLFHFGELTVPELKKYLEGRGVAVRPARKP